MFIRTLNALRSARFSRREDGSVAIEAAIIIPAVFLAFLAIFTVFDAYRQNSLHQKAAYTISDMVSRETVPIDNDYLDGAHSLFDTLTRDPQESAIRVSVLRYDAEGTQMAVDWSQTRGAADLLDAMDVSEWNTILPVMVDQERIIIVETWAKYVPPFVTGMGTPQIHNFVFTRPRYAPQVLWEGMEGGFSGS